MTDTQQTTNTVIVVTGRHAVTPVDFTSLAPRTEIVTGDAVIRRVLYVSHTVKLIVGIVNPGSIRVGDVRPTTVGIITVSNGVRRAVNITRFAEQLPVAIEVTGYSPAVTK